MKDRYFTVTNFELKPFAGTEIEKFMNSIVVE